MKQNKLTGVFTEGGRLRSILAVFSAAFFFFFQFILMQMGSTLQVDLMRMYGLNAAQFSFLMSMYFYGNTLFLIPAGIVLDHYSIRRVMIPVVMCAVLCTLGFALTHDLKYALLYRFYQGATNAFCFITCVLVTTQQAPPHRHGFVMGSMIMLAMSGGIVAKIPFLWLVTVIGWRQAQLVIALFGVFILALFFCFIHDERKQYTSLSFETEWRYLYEVSRNSCNWLYGLCIALMNFPVVVIAALWGVVFLQSVHGVSFEVASYSNGLILLGALLGAPLSGFLSDCVKKKQIILLCGAISSFLILILLLFLPFLSMNVIVVLLYLLGLAAATQVVGYPIVTEWNPSWLQAKATGFASVIVMGSAALVEHVTGILLTCRHKTDTHFTALDFQCAFGVMLFGFVVCSLICLRDLNRDIT